MRVDRMTTLVAVAALMVAAIPAVADGWGIDRGARAAGSHTVLLKNRTLSPSTVSIHRGESVTWVWENRGVLHNVIGHSFASPTQRHGSFAVRFTHSGTFSYKCTIHPHMDGTVIVH